MEKLYVFSEPQYRRLREVYLTPEESQFHQVYREMIKTLHRKDLNDEEKWNMYQALLTKYLQYFREKNGEETAAKAMKRGEAYLNSYKVEATGGDDDDDDGRQQEEEEQQDYGRPLSPYWKRRSLIFRHPQEVPGPSSLKHVKTKKRKNTVKNQLTETFMLPGVHQVDRKRQLRGRHKSTQTDSSPQRKIAKAVRKRTFIDNILSNLETSTPDRTQHGSNDDDNDHVSSDESDYLRREPITPKRKRVTNVKRKNQKGDGKKMNRCNRLWKL